MILTPEMQHLVDTLFDAVAHGDQEHRDWLKEAIDNHFKGLPVPPPRGKGTQTVYPPA